MRKSFLQLENPQLTIIRFLIYKHWYLGQKTKLGKLEGYRCKLDISRSLHGSLEFTLAASLTIFFLFSLHLFFCLTISHFLTSILYPLSFCFSSAFLFAPHLQSVPHHFGLTPCFNAKITQKMIHFFNFLIMSLESHFRTLKDLIWDTLYISSYLQPPPHALQIIHLNPSMTGM